MKVKSESEVTQSCPALHDQPRQHIKKQRHYFANKGPSSQSCGFSSSHVWMWVLDCKESWAPKNWCFELWCWRELLRVPWTTRRSNHSILKEINPEYSSEGLMLKLKVQYFGHLMRRTYPFEKTLMLRKIDGGWRRGQQRMKLLHGITDSTCCSTWGCKESDTTERLNWTELNWINGCCKAPSTPTYFHFMLC